MLLPRFVFVLSIAGNFLVSGMQLGAQDAGHVLAKKILTEGWDRSPKARNESQGWYESASPNVRAQTEVRWSYALNRMHHRKFREAKPIIDELAQANPANWDIAYAQLWLAAFVDEFEQCLLLMQQMKQRMDSTRDLSQQQRTENYFRLGRLFGYLQGPYAANVSSQSLNSTLAALQAGADEESLDAFNTQRDGVLQQYEQLMASRNQKQETELETLVRQRKVELEQQAALVQQLEKQSTEARSNRERVISDGQAEVDRQKQRLDDVTAEWNRIQSHASSVRVEINALWFSILQIDNALKNETDPVIRQRLLMDRNYFLVLVRDKEYYLNTLRANVDGVYSALGSASASYDNAVGTMRGRVNEVDQVISSAEKSRERANRRIRTLQAEPRVSNTLVATIDAQAEALSSYDPFPADLLKQRLVETMKTAKQ